MSPNEVSSYVFAQNADNDHNISPIKINDEGGISQEEFMKVSKLFHYESIKLQKNLLEN